MLDFFLRCRDTCNDILLLLGGWSYLPNCSVKYRNEKLPKYNFGFLVLIEIQQRRHDRRIDDQTEERGSYVFYTETCVRVGLLQCFDMTCQYQKVKDLFALGFREAQCGHIRIIDTPVRYSNEKLNKSADKKICCSKIFETKKSLFLYH